MPEPLVSVCVQTYNHGAYIAECLTSVLAQKTHFTFEVIVGEDGSTDGSREVCKDFQNRYPDQVRLFLRKREDVIYINGKPTGRYNFTQNLMNARGKYIALLDGDDYWISKQKLQSQVDILEADQSLSGCFHKTYMIKNDVKEKRTDWRNYSKKRFSVEDTISTRALLHPSSFMFRRENLVLPDWFIQIASADLAVFALQAIAGDFLLLDEFMSVYRKHQQGVTYNQNKIQFHLDRIFFYQKLKSHLGNQFNDKISLVISYHQEKVDFYHLNSITKFYYLVLNRLGIRKFQKPVITE